MKQACKLPSSLDCQIVRLPFEEPGCRDWEKFFRLTDAGVQFQVNTYTTDYQSYPSVAADADGDFVVVWDSFGSSGGDTSCSEHPGPALRQRRDRGREPVPGQHLHHQLPARLLPSLRTRTATSSWCGTATDRQAATATSSIQGQRYDSAGSAVGSQFQVNTYTTSIQYRPSVAADADGDFVVVWAELRIVRRRHQRLEHPGPALRQRAAARSGASSRSTPTPPTFSGIRPSPRTHGRTSCELAASARIRTRNQSSARTEI